MGKQILGPFTRHNLQDRQDRWIKTQLNEAFGQNAQNMLATEDLDLSKEVDPPGWLLRALSSHTHTHAEQLGLGQLIKRGCYRLDNSLFLNGIGEHLHPELERFLRFLAKDKRVSFYCERYVVLRKSYINNPFFVLIEDGDELILLQGQPDNQCLGRPQPQRVIRELIYNWQHLRPSFPEEKPETDLVLLELVQAAFQAEEARVTKAFRDSVAVSSDAAQICQADWVVVVYSKHSGSDFLIAYPTSSFKQAKAALLPDTLERRQDKQHRAVPQTAEQVVAAVVSNLGKSRWKLSRRQFLIRGKKVDGQTPFKILVTPLAQCNSWDIKGGIWVTP